MSMPKAVRHINETRTLHALFQSGPMSRAELARELGITRSTASSIVASLMEAGIVAFETATSCQDRNRTGRPSTRVVLCPQHAVFLGADIAVGRISITAIDLTANVIALENVEFAMDDTRPMTVAGLLAKEVSRVVKNLGSPEAVKGLNVTVPGLVDFSGTVVRAPLLGWERVPLSEMIQKQLSGIEITKLENDANAFAFADLQQRADTEIREAVYLFADAGVGGCLISNGAILRGFNGYAGEIGHIIVGEDGFFHQKTIRGSLESFVARQAVLARHQSLGGTARSIGDFVLALERNEEAAHATLRDWSHYLGRGLATLTSILNPEKIYLGGALGPLYSRAKPDIMSSVRKHLLPGSDEPQIELSCLGIEAPAIGAAMMLHREFFDFDRKLLFGRD